MQLLRRDRRAAAYGLGDMAADGAGLLDALGLDRAHVVGASMGGMIAQLIAARYPERVLSLASIMSNTGHRWRGMPGLRIYPMLLRRPARDRDGAVDAAVEAFRRIGSPGFPFEEAELRDIAGRSWDRGHDPAGTARQLAAILTTGDRSAELRRITRPDGRHPRHQGPHGHALGRAGDRAGDRGERARLDRRDGPRPPARRVAADPRRDRAQRGARRRGAPGRPDAPSGAVEHGEHYAARRSRRTPCPEARPGGRGSSRPARRRGSGTRSRRTRPSGSAPRRRRRARGREEGWARR